MQMDAVKDSVETKKNSGSAEEMCEIAIEELKKHWSEDEFLLTKPRDIFRSSIPE